jgi:IPT/TIG domain
MEVGADPALIGTPCWDKTNIIGRYGRMARVFRIGKLLLSLAAVFLYLLAGSSRLSAQAPTLTLISPSTATSGSPAFILNLTGTNFNAASQVQWNGSARPTTFISAAQLTAAIPASDIVAPGVAQVTVFNPTSGLTSNPLPFNILGGPPPPPASLPTLTNAGPPIASQGSQHLRLTLQGTNFRSGASVLISPPLAVVQLSQANQQAADVAVESVSRINNSLIVAVISVGPRAAPGLRAVDVVNSDNTNTGALPATGSGTSKPLNIALANSLAAPLGIQTIAMTQPRDGLVISQGDDFFAQAILAGTGTGTVTGEWLWDGVASEQFAVNMAGGERVLLRAQRGLPTLWLGLHTVGLRITAPNLIESRPIQVLINPGDWSTMRLLWPAPGAQFAAATPPSLKWLPVPGASLYQVGFSSQPYFSSIKTWHDVKDNDWRMPQEFWDVLPDGESYWTVRVVEASGETRKPLSMRRLIKNPAKPAAAKPAGHGPAPDAMEESQDQAKQETPGQPHPAPAKSDAEPEPAAAQKQQPQPPRPPTTQAQPPLFPINQSQMSANTQWASGSAPDTSVLAFAQQTSFTRGPWRADINGSGLLNAVLGPEPQHALGRANDYVFRLAYDRPMMGLSLRFGVLAPALYVGSEFVTTTAARQGVEPSLRTRAGTFAFWTNTNDVALGAGAGASFHQRLTGASYEAPLPQTRALLRFMWLSARDTGAALPSNFTADGRTVIAPSTLVAPSRGDIYGGLLQIHLGPQWLWSSEYSWSNNNPSFGAPASPALFGRAWRTGIAGLRWKTQLVLAYRDVGPNFSTPANPALSSLGVPGRRGADVSVVRPFRIGTFTVAYQYLESDVGQNVRPRLSMHNLSGAWSKSLTTTTVASLQVHEVHTHTGETPAPSPGISTDTRDFGATGSVNRSFHNFTVGLSSSRSWFRNRVLNTANVITSSVGVNANFKASSFFQLNSNVSCNWIAADKNSVGGTRAISTFLQPMLQWQKTGLSVSPLITVGQTHTLLSTGMLTAETLTTQYGGRLGWQFPGRLKFSTLTFDGGQVTLRNGLTKAEQRDLRLLALWTLVWTRRNGTQ